MEAFVDIETTGTDPARHEIFEIAIVDDEGASTWAMNVDISKADPGALRVNRWYARQAGLVIRDPSTVAREVAERLACKHIVGCVPSFDARFLDEFLHAYGQCPAWDYHLVDVEALVAGKLGIRPPWKAHTLAQAIGVDPPAANLAHTALADALMAKAMFEKVFECKS